MEKDWEDLEDLLENSEYGKKAMALFYEGYNCSQSVVLAFADQYRSLGISEQVALRMSASFGGGMGRLREVCGTVSGMFMVAGILFGYDDPKDYEAKSAHYERIQLLAEQFRCLHGSIVCRELLGLRSGKDAPKPEKRTAAYYQKRPCAKLVGTAAAIMEEYIKKETAAL